MIHKLIKWVVLIASMSVVGAIFVFLIFNLLCHSKVCFEFVAYRTEKTKTFAFPNNVLSNLLFEDTFGNDYPHIMIKQNTLTPFAILRNNKPWIKVAPSNIAVNYIDKISCNKNDKDKMVEYTNLDKVEIKGKDRIEVIKSTFTLYNDDGSTVDGPSPDFDLSWGYRDGVWTKHQKCFTSEEEANRYQAGLHETYEYDFGLGLCNYNHIQSWCVHITNYGVSKTLPTHYFLQQVWRWKLPIMENNKNTYTKEMTTFIKPGNYILFPVADW